MARKLVRQAPPDLSQKLRRSVQLAFLALNVWIATDFYLFVRYYETGGQTLYRNRPPGVEGWLPIASLMNLKVLLATGVVPRLHPAGMFLLIAFVAASWIFRKSFCGWLCPVGTLSEMLWKLGRKVFRRNFQLPRALDVVLRAVKYLLLALFVYVVAAMSVAGIRAFLEGPYGVVDDVKMLNFFRHIGDTGLLVLGVFILASLFIQNFWCRFLCPYGALLGLTSWLSPARIRRNERTCIDCAKCAKACPSALPVDKLVQIRSVECTGCLECVAVCPAQDALAMSLPKMLGARPNRPALPAWAMAAGIALLFLGVAGFAKATGHWESPIPNAVYERLVPNADQAAHPMPGR